MGAGKQQCIAVADHKVLYYVVLCKGRFSMQCIFKIYRDELKIRHSSSCCRLYVDNLQQ